MLQFKDLTPSRQKFVSLVELHFPEIKERGTITYKEIQDIHEFFVSKREENKNYKVSKPLWLITSNAIERGNYKFPASDAAETTEEIQSEWDHLYYAELARYGIKPRP